MRQLVCTLLVLPLLLLGCSDSDDDLDPRGFTWSVNESGSLVVNHTTRTEGVPVLDREAESMTRQVLQLDGISLLEFDGEITEVLGFYQIAKENEVETPLLLQPGDGRVIISDGTTEVGEVVVEEINPDTLKVTARFTASGFDGTRMTFPKEDEDRFWGFGEQYNYVDLAGQEIPIIVQEQGVGRFENPAGFQQGELTDSYFPMPYFMDPAKGYGVLFDESTYGHFDMGKTNPKAWTAEWWAADEISFYVFGGPEPLDVTRQLTDVLGRPKQRPPEFAFRGVWLAGQGGTEEILRRVSVAQANDIPVTALWVQDWLGIRPIVGGGNFGVKYRWVHDEEVYPNLRQTIADLESQGIYFLGYFNNFIVQGLDHYETALERGYFPTRQNTGEPITDQWIVVTYYGGVLDVTNPEAVDYFQGYARTAAADFGMRGWMCDFGEMMPWDGVTWDGRSGAEFHNLYPERWHRINREVLEEVYPDGNWIMFTRSGYSNSHSTAQIVWAGDQEATWEEGDGIATVVPAGLTMGLSGIPFFTHDIAGFSGGPRDAELYHRWTELGAFSPFMRTHDGLQKNSNHMFDTDQETLDHFGKMARARLPLTPYLMNLANNAVELGEPMIMHTAMVDPEWEASLEAHEQWMLGRHLVFAPVVHEGETEVTVHLPQGEWEHLWSGDTYAGRQSLTVAAPVGEPAVFVRVGKLDNIAQAIRQQQAE